LVSTGELPTRAHVVKGEERMVRLPHGGVGGRRLRAVAVDTLLPARANSACTLDRLLGNGCDWLTVSLRRAAAGTQVSERTKPRGSLWLLHCRAGARAMGARA
jgi:hypothetical protein